MVSSPESDYEIVVNANREKSRRVLSKSLIVFGPGVGGSAYWARITPYRFALGLTNQAVPVEPPQR